MQDIEAEARREAARRRWHEERIAEQVKLDLLERFSARVNRTVRDRLAYQHFVLTCGVSPAAIAAHFGVVR
ncbi:MAG: hypothetical protein ABTQ31_17245 [Rhizobiaceae bacterium]